MYQIFTQFLDQLRAATAMRLHIHHVCTVVIQPGMNIRRRFDSQLNRSPGQPGQIIQAALALHCCFKGRCGFTDRVRTDQQCGAFQGMRQTFQGRPIFPGKQLFRFFPECRRMTDKASEHRLIQVAVMQYAL